MSSLFKLCDECRKLDCVGTCFTSEKAYKKEICGNCGKEFEKEEQKEV